MRSAIAIHLAVTFESPGTVPPDREDDPSGSTKGNNIPPIQRPDTAPVVIDVPPGTRPRIDLFVTIGSAPEGAEKVGPRKEETPEPGKDLPSGGGSREEGSPPGGSEGGR